MAQKKIIREDFLIAFVRALSKSMIDARMIRGLANYPDIEKIKENIKIYEKPESTLANVILMNQTPEVEKIMLDPFQSVKEVYTQKADIASIMQNQEENILPLPIPSPTQNKKQPRMQQNRPQMRRLPVGMIRAPNPGAPFSQPIPFMHKMEGMRMLPSANRPNVIPINNPVPQTAPALPEKSPLIGFDKLDKILSDPGVQTVECPGPNKPIIVYKGGAVQSSKLALTSDEIKNIMNDISGKTRIPLMSGVFKAAYGNLIITAVMSDFVGTRFMIQKKQQYRPPEPGSGY